MKRRLDFGSFFHGKKCRPKRWAAGASTLRAASLAVSRSEDRGSPLLWDDTSSRSRKTQ